MLRLSLTVRKTLLGYDMSDRIFFSLLIILLSLSSSQLSLVCLVVVE